MQMQLYLACHELGDDAATGHGVLGDVDPVLGNGFTRLARADGADGLVVRGGGLHEGRGADPAAALLRDLDARHAVLGGAHGRGVARRDGLPREVS